MRQVFSSRVVKTAALVGLVAFYLGGCAYDYMQNSDRIAYGAGDAVKSNLEAESVNPVNPTAKHVHGLGKDGAVIVDDTPPSN